MYKLSDENLKGLILEETGMGEDSSAIGLTLTAIKSLRKFADFNQSTEAASIIPAVAQPTEQPPHGALPGVNQVHRGVGMSLGYNINLNLPATSDPAVFNAIFKSLKENLLENN